MSLVNFKTIYAHVQALLPNESADSGIFRLFCIEKPQIDNKTLGELDTLCGYISLADTEDVSYKAFLTSHYKHIELKHNSYVIQRLVRVETVTLFNEHLPSVLINSEPVLIDSDYIHGDHQFAAQVCFANFSEEFKSIYNTRCPDLVFEFRVITPPSDEEALPFVYGVPLFAAMRPTDHEEFLDAALYKQFVVPDFVMVRGSKEASGFDLAPRALVDNCKDFNDDTLAEAVAHRIKIPACYQISIVFPKFFNHYGEFNHMPNQFLLRSRVSKMNMALEYDFLGNQDLQFTLMNRNSFPIYMVEDPAMPDEIPMRCVQFVPSATLTQKLSTFTDSDEMARFMGIILVLNDKKRKPKIKE